MKVSVIKKPDAQEVAKTNQRNITTLTVANLEIPEMIKKAKKEKDGS